MILCKIAGELQPTSRQDSQAHANDYTATHCVSYDECRWESDSDFPTYSEFADGIASFYND
jgi:hypothetical protein